MRDAYNHSVQLCLYARRIYFIRDAMRSRGRGRALGLPKGLGTQRRSLQTAVRRIWQRQYSRVFARLALSCPDTSRRL